MTQEQGPGVAEDERGAVGGRRRVERQIRAAGLEHGQGRHDELGRAIQEQPDAGLRRFAAFPEVRGEPVRPALKLREREPGRPVVDGRPSGVAAACQAMAAGMVASGTGGRRASP